MSAKKKKHANRLYCGSDQVIPGYVMISESDERWLILRGETPKNTSTPFLKDWLRYLYCRSEYILVVCLMCTFLSMLFTTHFISTEYTAVSKLLITHSRSSSVDLTDLQMDTYIALDCREVFNSWYIHECVLQSLDLPYSYNDLEGMLEIENPPNTPLVYIMVTSDSAEEAKRIADTYAMVAGDFIAASMKIEEPYFFEEALLPSVPSSPGLIKNAFKGYFFGLIASCAFLTALFLGRIEFGITAGWTGSKRKKGMGRFKSLRIFE